MVWLYEMHWNDLGQIHNLHFSFTNVKCCVSKVCVSI